MFGQGGLAGGVRGLVNPFVCFMSGTQVVVVVGVGVGVGVEVRGDDGRIETISAGKLAAMQEESGGVATRLEIVGYVTANIEDIVVRGGGEMGDGDGQLVISRDQHDPDGPLVYRRIARTYQRTAHGLQVLTVRDAEGVEQTLRVTEEHPFYVEFAGWTAAKSLRAGDTILGADGALAVVSNECEAHPQGVAVYNLEVEDAHTYFVMSAEGCDGAVWVHNANYDRPSGFRSGVRDKVWNRAIERKTGRVRDRQTGRFMSKNNPWDMGHRDGLEFRKHKASAKNRGISRKQFLDEYNKPSHYRPELPSSNRNHKSEASDDIYFGG